MLTSALVMAGEARRTRSDAGAAPGARPRRHPGPGLAERSALKGAELGGAVSPPLAAGGLLGAVG